MKYLKPNFTQSWLNYLVVLLVGLGSFSYTSIAFSWEDDGTWTEGQYYVTPKYGLLAPTRAGICAQTVGHPSNLSCIGLFVHAWSSVSSTWVIQYGPYTESCATGPYASNAASGCGVPPTPVNNCPDYGTVERIPKVINGTVENGVFIPRAADAVTTIEIGGGASKDGCGYAVPVGANVPQGFKADQDVSCAPSGIAGKPICTRWENMIATGELSSPGVGSPSTSLPTDHIEDDYGSSLLETTSDKVVGDVTVTDMAGVSSATQTITETLVKEKGAVVVDSVETAVVTTSDGIQKTVTTTVNTLDFPDGTTQVITETNTAFTQTPKTVFVIDKSTGVTSVTVQGGSSANYSETKTKGYDADGNEVSSKTETSGSGDGEAQEEKEGEECKEDPEKCKAAEFKKGEKGKYDGDAAQAILDGLITEYNETANEIFDSVEEKLALSFSTGSASISDTSMTWRGVTQTRTNNVVTWLDYINLGNLVLLIAGLVAMFILLRRSRD